MFDLSMNAPLSVAHGFPDIGSRAPDAINFGRFVNFHSRQIEGRLRWGNDESMLLFGPSGRGKGTRILLPNLLQCRDRSIFVVDPKGELAAVTAKYRRELGPVYVLNPFNVVREHFGGYDDLKSCGYNPLIGLDPGVPRFNRDAETLAAALITRDSTARDPHWPDSGRALVACALMWEVICARRERRVPDIGNLRVTLSLPSRAGIEIGTVKRPPEGIPLLARAWMKSGIQALMNKAGQFIEWTPEKSSIASTALAQTTSLDDSEIVTDMRNHAFDFRDLKRAGHPPITVYLILPPDLMDRHAKWLRLMISSALNAVMHPRAPGEPRVLFMLDEFAALGRLEIISTSWALVRGHGVQIMPVLQHLTQLKELYGEYGAQTFVAQAGLIASFGTNDSATAEMLSKRSGEMGEVARGYNHSMQGGGAQQNLGDTWSVVKVPRLPPDFFYGLRPGAMVHYAGGLLGAITAYAPNYWEIETCAQRQRPNPYEAWRLGGDPRHANPWVR